MMNRALGLTPTIRAGSARRRLNALHGLLRPLRAGANPSDRAQISRFAMKRRVEPAFLGRLVHLYGSGILSISHSIP